jgi:hypothetical protein
MTYDRAIEVACVAHEEAAAVSHGLTSSPLRGEGTHSPEVRVDAAWLEWFGDGLALPCREDYLRNWVATRGGLWSERANGSGWGST